MSDFIDRCLADVRKQSQVVRSFPCTLWVKVEDQLPADSEWVLVSYIADRRCFGVDYVFTTPEGERRWGNLQGQRDESCKVTHWGKFPVLT